MTDGEPAHDQRDESGTDSDLSELLGRFSDDVAMELRKTIQFLLSRLAARYRLAAEHFDDLVQEVLTICVQQAQKIQRGEAKPLANRDAWLCRVTHNAVLGLGRKKKRRPQDAEGWPEGFEPPSPAPLGHEERLTIRRALAALDETCRRLLILRDVLGGTRQLIADQLGITSNALGVRIHRCRKKLLELYEGLVST